MSKSQKSRRGDFIGMVLVACQILYTAATLAAQDAPSAKKILAQTPPMGWNSWDSYGLRINEEQFRANVEAMAAKLKPSGYAYAVIDKKTLPDPGARIDVNAGPSMGVLGHDPG